MYQAIKKKSSNSRGLFKKYNNKTYYYKNVYCLIHFLTYSKNQFINTQAANAWAVAQAMAHSNYSEVSNFNF